LFFSAGCVPMNGSTSLTMLARDASVASRFRPVGERVTERACSSWLLLLFMWGEPHRTRP
jgi:hypothetical protein